MALLEVLTVMVGDETKGMVEMRLASHVISKVGCYLETQDMVANESEMVANITDVNSYSVCTDVPSVL